MNIYAKNIDHDYKQDSIDCGATHNPLDTLAFTVL